MKSQQRRIGHRLALFIGGVVLTITGAVASSSTMASAHHPELIASATCEGVVNFTATSWVPPEGYPMPSSRINDSVKVIYQVNGLGPDIEVTTNAFTEGNGFTFSGQFPWPEAATDYLYITVIAQGTWGNGEPGGGAWAVSVQRPDMPCQEESTTTTEAATTTTEAATTTTAAVTTTTAAVTTTTAKATTTTQQGSDGPTTTQLGSDSPTTTVSRVLPRTGGGNGSLPLVALGLLLIGASLVLGTRRQIV